ncbi:MAG: THUMP domain-containing protein [Flavobacteriales bacterium]|nr:THUMP domain-containing protein [Flavobacteriales bacterium]
MKNYKLFAKTFTGLEPILAEEIRALGGKNIVSARRGVSFTGDLAMVYKANYSLRTALRILIEIKTFKAINEEQLYLAAKQLPWLDYLDVRQTFSVDATINSKYFNHSHYVALKVKDAIVDTFREKIHKRPNVDTHNPDVKFNVHLDNDRVTISLDSSVESLHLRGYRQSTGGAPLNECLAAGIILLSGWNMKTPFLDPMCGSGTLLIEASMINRQVPAGYHRKNWGFMKWLNYDAALFAKIKADENSKIFLQPTASIIGYDKSFSMVRTARLNAMMALADEHITIEKCNFFDISEVQPVAHIVTNPPYGERLEEGDMKLFCKEMGNILKRYYSGSVAWVIHSNDEAMKYFGLKPSCKLPLMNGPIHCKLYKFEMYSGTRRYSKQNDNNKNLGFDN